MARTRKKQQPQTIAVSIPLDDANLYYEATFTYCKESQEVSDIISYCKDYGTGSEHETPFDLIQKEVEFLHEHCGYWQADNAKDDDTDFDFDEDF